MRITTDRSQYLRNGEGWITNRKSYTPFQMTPKALTSLTSALTKALTSAMTLKGHCALCYANHASFGARRGNLKEDRPIVYIMIMRRCDIIRDWRWKTGGQAACFNKHVN